MDDSCIVCKSKLSLRIATFEDMCSQVQNLPTAENLVNDSAVKLDLYRCGSCGLVQFNCEPVDYYRDVIRAGGISQKMKNLRINQYRKFINYFNLNGKKIWEVGCGGGEFLEPLLDFPVVPFGTENSTKLTQAARSKDLDVLTGFVDSESFVDVRGPFDAFLSINFLEHQPHPVDMLKGIARNLTDNGVGLITVPAYEYIERYGAYYEYMRDHIAYYSKSSLIDLLDTAGFETLESTIFNEDTHQLFVKRKNNQPALDIKIQKEKLLEELAPYLYPGIDKNAAVWGASHQGLTLCSTLKLDVAIAFIVDSASFKWNHVSPASHIPIISPDEFAKDSSVGSLIIVAPGYADEIAKSVRQIRPDIQLVCSVIRGEVIKM